MCDVLNVSETGYYRFKRNLGRPSKDAVLSAVMQDVLDEHPFNDNYGVDRMQIALIHRGYTAGKRRISRIMKENGWLQWKASLQPLKRNSCIGFQHTR